MSMDGVIDAARGIGTVGIASFVTWIGIRQTGKKNKTDTAQSMFDQLQEERDAAQSRHDVVVERLEGKLKAADARMDKFAEDMRAAYRRELLRDDFIQELRNHIRLDLGPPPPEWPEELRRG